MCRKEEMLSVCGRRAQTEQGCVEGLGAARSPDSSTSGRVAAPHKHVDTAHSLLIKSERASVETNILLPLSALSFLAVVQHVTNLMETPGT